MTTEPVMQVVPSDEPYETREFEKGRFELFRVGPTTLGRATYEPGWRWSESVAPIAGTPSCQVHHNGYCVSGRMQVRMDDGGEREVGPGDVFVIPPGHDAWVVGDERFVALEFESRAAEDYARS